MTNLPSVARTAGAAALVGGMTFAPTKPAIMMPVFVGSWAAVAYGLTNGFRQVNPFLGAGTAGIVAGGLAERLLDNKIAKHVAQGAFMLGWAGLSEGIARTTGASRFLTYGSSAIVLGGITLIRKRKMEGDERVPVWLGPLLFAVGWAGVLAGAAGLTGPAR